MYETAEDLTRLQELLDQSHARAGSHLRSILTDERRLDAAALAERLQGMSLLVLATPTKDGRPLNGPVDGIFYRGAFHFGSAPNSIRFRHIAKRPYVSATHVPREEFAVTVHGKAVPVETTGGFRKALLDIYVPRYGAEWEEFLDSGPVYARIEPERMFTFNMD